VKGAYAEPADIAYPRKSDVDDAYARLVDRALASPTYVAIATHDTKLIGRAMRAAKQHGYPNQRFEFQMLYGVRPDLQLDLVSRGYTTRVATPFGPDWYPYLMRRLAERPANVGFLIRNQIKSIL
jgi:proline dehydrogenase